MSAPELGSISKAWQHSCTQRAHNPVRTDSSRNLWQKHSSVVDWESAALPSTAAAQETLKPYPPGEWLHAQLQGYFKELMGKWNTNRNLFVYKTF